MTSGTDREEKRKRKKPILQARIDNQRQATVLKWGDSKVKRTEEGQRTEANSCLSTFRTKEGEGRGTVRKNHNRTLREASNYQSCTKLGRQAKRRKTNLHYSKKA